MIFSSIKTCHLSLVENIQRLFWSDSLLLKLKTKYSAISLKKSNVIFKLLLLYSGWGSSMCILAIFIVFSVLSVVVFVPSRNGKYLVFMSDGEQWQILITSLFDPLYKTHSVYYDIEESRSFFYFRSWNQGCFGILFCLPMTNSCRLAYCQ